MIRRKHRQDDPVSFQITPMIDMTFLLLIFFMLTTQISKEKVKLDVALPAASAAITPDDLSNRDIINLDAEGNFYIANDQVTRDQLNAYLKQRFINAPPLRIYLRADKLTPSKTIRDFMKMATEAGATNVIFGSYSRP
ncbi:biopolymer transporter ExbD [Phragmitibacter flavus]|uniref:Biopolymer transporter ExbD n=1 Tax=Phragmitibacter flavus TaxID=2576071 RepID=A0A5R8KIX3_9BACT|nr:biopolymer transporter ExbD [Phragmitibacter flavus]TLD72191.1 biopolymer transporter ExbD [Phragmitibacter flavus]